MSLSTRQRPLEFMTDAELTAILRDSEQFLAAPQEREGIPPTSPLNRMESDMKLRIVLLAGATTLFLGAGFSPADASGSKVLLEQYGKFNSFGSSQSGKKNRLTVYQRGYANSGISSQYGKRNKAVIGQQGKFNYADTWQSGRHNIAGVAQFGKGHSAVTSQDRLRQRHRRDPGRARQQRQRHPGRQRQRLGHHPGLTARDPTPSRKG